MVIPHDISGAPKFPLMEMMIKSEESYGWKFENFKTDSPSLDLHKILAEDCHGNWLEQQLSRQRRLHPTMMEVNENKGRIAKARWDVNEGIVVTIDVEYGAKMIPAVTFNTAALVLVHDDDTVREEVDTVNGGNAVVGSNVVGSSYDHEDHVVGQEHVEVEGEDVDVGPRVVDVGPDAKNGPEIVDNESSDDNGSEHVEVGPEITDIWADHVDVNVGAGVDDVNGNGANHVDVDDNGNGANHVDVGPDSKNGSQHAENGPDSDNGLDHVDIGPEVDDVEPELGDDRPELADDDTTDDNGAEDWKRGEAKDIKEKATDREQATYREGQPVQPDNVDEAYGSSEKDGKLEGYETDYISSSDPGEYEDSEQSDDDAPRVRQSLFPRYDPNCVIPVWELGLRFDDNKQFKEAVRKYAFAKGVQLKIVKNEPNRTRFHCMKGCPWTLFASTDKKLRCYTVKTYNHVHKCYRTNKNKLISAKYIQKQFKDIILANPKMKVKTLKEMCKRELGVYASFNLKTAQKGELLVAVGRDANNQMFLIAWVVVEVEYASSWRWFLQKLFTDLEHPTGEGITLMSDQQKGLVKVLVEDYPDIEYRMCARHLYANWQKKWKGMNRKLSTYIEEFDDNLQKLEKLGPTSTEDLLQIPVQHWKKAYFSARPTCDVVDNNMAEAFNAWILDARCKPIISLLEDIRIMMMSRLHVKRTWASKWRTNISPKALEKLEHNMEQSTHCRLVWNGDGGFEVQHGEDQHIVDMKQLKCTCRAWELSGIPCCHAICAMYQENKRPEDYVSNWYNKEKYLAAYNHVL
ncbi:hypothetical protein GQ457_10G014170 [Hibiscus cannabinus]